MVRCKPCANPHDSPDLPRSLPARLTPYVLNNYTTKSSPYHVTEDEVNVLIESLEVENIADHRSVRGEGGVIVVLHETHWKGLLQLSWERDMGLQHSRQHVVRYWAGTPPQHQQENRLYRRMHVGAAQRELSRETTAPDLVSRVHPRHPPTLDTSLHHYRLFRRHPLPVSYTHLTLPTNREV